MLEKTRFRRVSAPETFSDSPSAQELPDGNADLLQVIIVGGGPVGLTLAIDLGRRGVHCVLIERDERSIQLPKMERCNARTMEIYRRLGIAEKIRDEGLHPATRRWMSFWQLNPWPTRRSSTCRTRRLRKRRERSRRATMDSRLNPINWISQYTLEPLLQIDLPKGFRRSPCVSAAN